MEDLNLNTVKTFADATLAKSGRTLEEICNAVCANLAEAALMLPLMATRAEVAAMSPGCVSADGFGEIRRRFAVAFNTFDVCLKAADTCAVYYISLCHSATNGERGWRE